jgi:hypothetical protein
MQVLKLSNCVTCEMCGALKDLALEIREFRVNELGKLCRIVTQCIGERQLELLLQRELPLLHLGRSQLIPHWRLHLLLPDVIAHIASPLAKTRTPEQLKQTGFH